MRRPHHPKHLLVLTFRLIKYFLLGLVGCTIAYVIALVFDLPLVSVVIVVFLEQVLARSLVVLGCLWAIAVISESTRY
ncbi:hypothetical protein IQ254_02780 [Nodosilinea sp. LEGE 07088]|uniref:hypothetical protein n=1 Tax=Nodosilinea sp. LEGE 07088 TaxID=2777968 RepID=UPI00187E2AEE|nr:hypothetical protein [Nodosilinea sp. LEGE 07088]MBE9136134.1 hypothetical protein [Nodosilinea sp. LEGE 07088]